MEDLRVAAVAMHSEVGRKAENLDRMEFFVKQAAREGAQVICFPELNVSGYGPPQEMDSFVEPIPGPSSQTVLKMAQDHHLLILAGLAEKGPSQKYFISHMAANPDGSWGVYRKLHLGPAEEEIFQPGQECPVFQFGQTTFGIELCFDGHFPELSTILALKGAEVIFMPHASPRESSQQKQGRWLRYLTARAYDNSIFVLACNPVGRSEFGLSFAGAALILNPRGEILAARTDEGEGMILAELKRETLRGIRENSRGFFLRKRRPALYKDLTHDGGQRRPRMKPGSLKLS